MIVYLIMLALSLFFAVYAQNTKPYPALKNSYQLLAFLAAVPFVFVSVFRDQVGVDWNLIYAPYYYYINNGIDQFREIGFVLLNRLLYLFTEDSWILFAVVGFFTNCILFTAIFQQSDSAPWSIFLYFLLSYYFASLNQIRQMLAMSMFLYSLKYVYSREFWKYEACILFATLFHLSSLMYIPVYFIYSLRMNYKQRILLFLACVMCLPVLRIVIVALVSLTSYGWYFESEFLQNDFYLLGFLVHFVYMAVHIFYQWRSEKRKEEDTLLDFYNSMILFATVLMLFSAVIPQVQRVAEGFSVVLIFGMPRMLKSEPNAQLRLVTVAGMVAMILAKFLFDTYINAWHGALPYQFVF